MSLAASFAGDDIDRIMAVMASAFDPQWGEAWSRSQLEGALMMGHCHYRLIDADGEAPRENRPAAGFALLRETLDESELLLFAVAPQWRQQGLGAKLLNQVLNEAKASGITRMLLEMRQGNTAERLYRAYGFVPIGLRPKYYKQLSGNRIDAITLCCTLD